MLWAASALNKQTPKRLSPTRVDFIRAGVGWLLAETASLQVGDVIASDTRVAYCQSGDCLAAPLALTSSWKSKGALGALLRIRAQDLSNPSKPTEKELISAKNWKDSDAAKQRSPGHAAASVRKLRLKTLPNMSHNGQNVTDSFRFARHPSKKA